MSGVSPLQGLERISTELQQERAKCTAALKDRAKQKIEIEKLKQKNQLYQQELAELREQLEDADQQLQTESDELYQSTNKLSDKDKEIARCQSELETALSKLAKSQKEIQVLKASYEDLHEKHIAARSAAEDESDTRLQLERQVQELQESNQRLRALKGGSEETLAAMSAKYAEQVRELEEFRKFIGTRTSSRRRALRSSRYRRRIVTFRRFTRSLICRLKRTREVLKLRRDGVRMQE